MFECINQEPKCVMFHGESILIYIGYANDGSQWHIFQKSPDMWMAKCISELGHRRSNIGKVFYRRSLPLVEKALIAMR